MTGENGAAKTTLIKASLGILQPRIGKVTISKTNTQGKKLRIAYLPQQIASFNAGFPSTVYEFVKSGRYPRKGWFRRLNAHDEEHIKASLDSVGMWEHRDKTLGFSIWRTKAASGDCAYVCFGSRCVYPR